MGSGEYDTSHVLPVVACEHFEHTSPSRSRLLRYLSIAFTATALVAFVLWPHSSGPHCGLPSSLSGRATVLDHVGPIQRPFGDKHAGDGEKTMGYEYDGMEAGIEHALDTAQHADDENGEPVWCHFNSTHPMPVGSYTQEFKLSPSSSELFIAETGSTIRDGQVLYEAVDNGTGDVRLRFAFDTNMEGCSMNICLMQKPSGGAGLVLSAYEGHGRMADCWAAKRVLGAQITFPRPEQGSPPTRVNNFRAHLGHVSQELRDLREDIYFDKLSLQSTDRSIVIDSLYTRNLSLETDRGDISLKATVHGSAAVRSNWGSISAGLTLVARSHAGGYHAPTLSINTFFGALRTDVALAGDPGPDDAIHYTIRAGTDAAPNVLNVTAIPSRANLDLLTRTAFSNTLVTLHPAFEGNIKLFSKDGALPMLSVHPHPEDPERRGRDRTVKTEISEDENGLTIAGQVFWGSQAERLLVGRVVCMSGDEASLRVQL